MGNMDLECGERRGTPFTVVMTVTPEKAAEWLEHNGTNRAFRPERAKQYARLMLAGKWRLNGEPISFDWNGDIVSAQHRLHAVVLAGVPVQMQVTFGLDPEVRETVDQGLKRSTADALRWMGEANVYSLAAALRLLWRYEQGIWHRTGAPNPTTEELIDLLAAHPELQASHSPAYKANRVLVVSMGVTLHYLFKQRDPEMADWFFEALASGVELQTDQPVRVLRERLIAGRGGKARLLERERLALVLKAWNLTRQGSRVRFLRWRNEGDSPEPFPEII